MFKSSVLFKMIYYIIMILLTICLHVYEEYFYSLDRLSNFNEDYDDDDDVVLILLSKFYNRRKPTVFNVKLFLCLNFIYTGDCLFQVK